MRFIRSSNLGQEIIPVVALLVLLAGATGPVTAQDDRPAPPERAADGWGSPVGLDEVGAGELLWKSDRGLIPLPALDVRVELNVNGVLLGGRVTQRFRNPTTETIEAVYAFPLPERAAVHRMEMRIGERTIRSVIREKEQARRTYEAARSSGRKTALVDRHRPNLFTTSAANINPGETVSIVLEYLDEADFEDGSYYLAFPLAYLPRYAPANYLSGVDEPEREALLGCHDSAAPSVPEATIEVRLRPGIELAHLDSVSHAIVRRDEGDTILVRTANERVPASRDFRLRWTPKLSELPRPSILFEDRADGRYAMLMLYPPIPGSQAGLGLPTETLFIVDVSSSMRGPSIEQARLALAAALYRLRPDDRFNILKFNDGQRSWRPDFVYADEATVDEAHEWVRGLRATGGTSIHPALVRGLQLMGASSSSHAQRIIFLTDGAVANEEQVYSTITAELGSARLHAIGIGPAPNSYLMRKMARFGRGICRFVASADDAENRIDAFFERLDRPVMTDLTLEWAGLVIDEAYPARLPDLHAGEPLVLVGRVDPADDTPVRLVGHTRVGWVETEALPAAITRHGSGIAIRWARSRVEALMDSLHEGTQPTDVREAVIDVALEFDLVTKYTSLVAVEQGPTAFGEPRPVRLAASLPQGGTDAPLRTAVGLSLLGAGLFFLALLRR